MGASATTTVAPWAEHPTAAKWMLDKLVRHVAPESLELQARPREYQPAEVATILVASAEQAIEFHSFVAAPVWVQLAPPLVEA